MSSLLLNGDFEGDFHSYHNVDELSLAQGWAPWWNEQAGDDPAWKNRRPEFRKADLELDPTRVRNGESAQHYFTFWGTHTAGGWQQVVVPPGAQLRLHAWGSAWSSESDQPRPSVNSTNTRMCVGIDPLGGTDPESPSIVWAPRQNAIDDWRLFGVEAQALTDVITVFFHSAPEWPKKHQDIFWDEASLEIVAEGPEPPADSGGERNTQVECEPGESPLQNPVTVRVISTREQAYASLEVRDPVNSVRVYRDATAGRQEDDFWWEYIFTPELPGPYLLVFRTDNSARVITWRRVTIGAQDRLEAMRTEGTSTAEPLAATALAGPAAAGLPRRQYERTYVLLPPTADSVWAEAAMRGGFDTRRTVGFSADDAGLGDLDERRVIAVNPHHWRTELTADWYNKHYPGTRFFSLIVDTPEELEQALRSWRA